MSKANAFETNLLELIFLNTALENIGDAAGLQPSASAGDLYIALFTSDPGEAAGGVESAYTGYARAAVARGSGWSVSAGQAQNANTVQFPKCTGGSETITHFAIMTASSGGDMIYHGALNSELPVSNNITPQFAAGAITVTED